MSPVLHLSQKNSALRQFHRSLLPRVKVNRNFPLELRPIDPAFGSLGLKPLELEQVLESILQVISRWDSVTPASNVIWVSLEFLQLEVSSADLAINKCFSFHGYLSTTGWLASV